jgi:hypothetical protein
VSCQEPATESTLPWHKQHFGRRINESPAQYQEIHGDIYADYVDSSNIAID